MDPSLSISIEPPPLIPPPPIPSAPVPGTAFSAVPTNAGFPAGYDHPPYHQMIEEAIRALNEQDGSSKRSIAKYIEGAYKDLPPTHSDLLTHCLKRLKDSGDLVMVKKSYKLARSENHLPPETSAFTSAASAGPKRGRGRPPKPKPDAFPVPNPNPLPFDAEPVSQLVSSSVVSTDELTVPNSQPVTEGGKRRGRPKKNWPEQILSVTKRATGLPRKNGTVGSRKRPGRPRKLPVVAADAGQPVSNGVKRRGRPPKAQTQAQDQAQAQVLNQPQPIAQPQFLPPFLPQPQFQPPSQFMQLLPHQLTPPVIPFQAHPMVVPYADASSAVPNAPAGVPNAPRRRGRPKGTATAAAAGVGSVTGKRRGRPPKIGGVSKPMKPKKTTGRPMGRPRKKVEGLESQSVTAAYGDLKRKLGFFQSKVMQAVGVLKPQFSSESNLSAVAALQELEGLAAMDLINTPFIEEGAQPPLPPNGGLVH